MASASEGGTYTGGSGVARFVRQLDTGTLQAVAGRTSDRTVLSGQIYVSIFHNRGTPQDASGETLLAAGYVTEIWSPSWTGMITLASGDFLLMEINGTATAPVFMTALIHQVVAPLRIQ